MEVDSGSLERPVLSGDYARRHGAAEAVGVAYRDDLFADFGRVGIAERKERKVLSLYLYHSEVEGRVLPYLLRVEGTAVEHRHADFFSVLDDVVVGKDVAVLADDEARALAAARHLPRLLRSEELLAEEFVEERMALEGVHDGLLRHHALDVDVDDRRGASLYYRYERVLDVARRRQRGDRLARRIRFLNDAGFAERVPRRYIRAGRAAREKDQRRQGRRRDFFEFFQTETPPKISLYSFALHVGYNSIRSTKVNKNYRGLFVKSQSRARSRFAVRISHAAPTIIPAVQT